MPEFRPVCRLDLSADEPGTLSQFQQLRSSPSLTPGAQIVSTTQPAEVEIPSERDPG